jgi:hypothetical protein
VETAPPLVRDRSGPLLAGGIVLTTIGGLTILLIGVAVLGSIATGDFEENPGYGVAGIGVTLFGGAQVWAGILAILRRRAGRLMGLVVAGVGVALAMGLVVEAFVAEDALGDLVLAAIELTTSITVIILLIRGVPRS